MQKLFNEIQEGFKSYIDYKLKVRMEEEAAALAGFKSL